jgi:subtilisin family serine protease
MAGPEIKDWFSRRFEELVKRPLEPVEVSVLDSGIDSTHPDLAGRIVESVGVEIRDGIPHIENREACRNNDVYGHGTAVASIICRLAPNARIVDVGVLGENGVGMPVALVAGLEYAVQRQSRIINMSLAARAEFAPLLWRLCELAYRQNQFIVAARRNMPLTDDGFPAEFSSSIGVDRGSFPSPYQLRFHPGGGIEYSAQSEEVVVAAPGGGYTVKTGTSFSTPAVTAMCALLAGAYPGLRFFEVKTLLKAFAE